MIPRLIVRPDDVVVADRVEVASGPLRRLRGLIGTRDDGSDWALLIPGAKQIHTFAMRFAIDVIFCSGNGEVLHVARAVRPWRVTGVVLRSRFALELPAGGASGVGLGDRLALVPAIRSRPSPHDRSGRSRRAALRLPL